MKKILVIIICMMLTFSFVGCQVVKPDIQDPPQVEHPVLPPAEPIIPDIPQIPDELPEPPKPEPPTPEPPKPEINKTTMVMATTNVSVRSGAGTSFNVVGSMESGDRLKYIMTKNGWYQIYFKGKKAYVSANYCALVSFEMGSRGVEKVIAVGETYLGTPYIFGAERYHWGNGVLNSNFTVSKFDCSSLMQYMFKVGANVNIATTSREQSLQGKAVSKANLKRGDLMFFTNSTRFNNSGLERIGHVGIYLGDNYILHTASDFAVIEPINNTRWSYFISARRHIN